VRSFHVLVVAKSPVAGRVKTRMCPPLSHAAAAQLAEAALVDTLRAVAGCRVERRLLALDGPVGSWMSPGFEVFAQEGTGLDERLAAAWEHAGGPGLQIGMDTPQVTPELLDSALEQLARDHVTAVLGPASDGGWWAIGLKEPDPRVFVGVPMSTPSTASRQLSRLVQLGHRPVLLPTLRDVDRIEDAVAVADMVPGSTFSGVSRRLISHSLSGSAR